MSFPKEYDFADVLIQPRISPLKSRKEVSLEREIAFPHGSWKGVPIIAANMDTTGTFEVYRVLQTYKMITALHKFYTLKDYQDAESRLGIVFDPEYFMISTGITDENLQNLQEIMAYTNCNWICIDVANGYMESLVHFCRKIRKMYPTKRIVAGNVVCYDMATDLYHFGGANVIKVGIGSGSACLTRRQTGVGRRQLSAILDTAKLHDDSDHMGYIISDGGIKEPADVAKAFAAGADFVMIGGMFAGHDENPGNVIDTWDGQFKEFYGMSSKHAMEKHYGGMEKHRSSEGAVIRVPYKGALEDTIMNLLGGLRSTCSYLGVKELGELPKYTKFYA
jgi:GMP reductase